MILTKKIKRNILNNLENQIIYFKQLLYNNEVENKNKDINEINDILKEFDYIKKIFNEGVISVTNGKITTTENSEILKKYTLKYENLKFRRKNYYISFLSDNYNNKYNYLKKELYDISILEGEKIFYKMFDIVYFFIFLNCSGIIINNFLKNPSLSNLIYLISMFVLFRYFIIIVFKILFKLIKEIFNFIYI